MRAIVPCFLFAFFVCAASAESTRSGWAIASETKPESIGPRIEFLEKTLRKSTPDGESKITLHLVHFWGGGFTLKVVDQGDAYPGRYENLPEAMRRNFCIAGCNGGFFHPDFKPSGLVIADRARANRFQKAKLLSGVLLVDKRGPRILRAHEFEDHAGITQLLQSGPFLVDRGKTVAGLSASPARNRTFIMAGARSEGVAHWAIGLCTGISLADLGEVLADPSIVGEFRVDRALNLDGGSSSSLYFDRGAGNAPYHYRTFVNVRNFVGVTAK